MEKAVNDAISFSNIDLEASQSQFGDYLDHICPYFLLWGMSWEAFWYGNLNRLFYYWQKNQYEIERKNQELWVQGMYFMEALASVNDTKHRVKYPDKPHRLTEMSDVEKEAEKRRRIEEMREQLDEAKWRWDANRKRERAE